MIFYRLNIPSFTQYKYAWAESPDDANISEEYYKCPKCDSPVSMLHFKPPCEIEIYQPRKVGDFVSGVIPCDIIVSERFKEEYTKSNLKGFKNFFELKVTKLGSKGNKQYSGPKLFGGNIEIPLTQVDYNKMEVKWDDRPQKGYCDLCGPGGGGINGIVKSHECISIIESTWTGLDFFIPINFSGNIMITEKAKNMIESNSFENYEIIEDVVAKYDAYNIKK